MARNYKPKRFTKIGLLKKMDFPLLLRLLEPYRLYFEGHPDFVWAATSDQFRFDVLAEVMLNLDTTIPKDLLESLYYIETMADNDYFDELYAAAKKRGYVRMPHQSRNRKIAIIHKEPGTLVPGHCHRGVLLTTKNHEEPPTFRRI